MGTPDVNVRGVRQTIPPGYVLGRLGGSAGPARLIPIKDLGVALQSGGILPPLPINNVPKLEFLGVSLRGPFLPQDQYEMPQLPCNVTFPSAVVALPSQTRAWARIAPTSNYSFYLVSNLSAYLANGSSVLATVAFLAAATTGTITYSSSTLVPKKAVLWVVGQAITDPTLAEVLLQFVGDPS
jgi:hypothetical protein